MAEILHLVFSPQPLFVAKNQEILRYGLQILKVSVGMTLNKCIKNLYIYEKKYNPAEFF